MTEHRSSMARDDTDLTRRTAVATAVIGGVLASAPAKSTKPQSDNPTSLSFPSLPRGVDTTHRVAAGHTAQVLLRWGDPVFADAPALAPGAMTAAAQGRQFGTDCDFIHFAPLPMGSDNSDHGLLCVNHESAFAQLMFAGAERRLNLDLPPAAVDVQMAAHGHTVVEIRRDGEQWSVVRDSRYNRRITALDTAMTLTGPAAGHDRLKTSADPTGRTVIGTISNCAGGATPWGTVLIAEENFHQYFGGDPTGTPEERNHRDLYGITSELYYNWFLHHPRFNVEAEPHEPNRFGWMVEIDPYDPASTPKKRTALGRIKHEGAGLTVNRDGRLVAYMGDDEAFQFIYRFVSTGRVKTADRSANDALLDEGTLSVARFDDGGRLTWLPLVWGQGPLTAANGFGSQADVLIEPRRAAALLGATPMDRPEEIEPNPVTGSVFVCLTKNGDRDAGQVDAANPRARNVHGHVLELIPPAGADGPDHAAAAFDWRPFLMGGDPADPTSGAMAHAESGPDDWLSCPDNIAFDPRGRAWLSTDGAEDFATADGLWAADVTGPGRALARKIFSCPQGAELTGPCFTPDGRNLFVSVQHPAEGSTYARPSTRWPDFQDDLPPRSSVVVIRKSDGSPVG
ncbi:MAG: PhoX family phosphatase [Rhodospirillaceae bacterium]|nr:PhoX family phosphatase [Rhodospirillaceae bacterium]